MKMENLLGICKISLKALKKVKENLRILSSSI